MREIETGTDHLLAKIENGVGYLTMNRPDARKLRQRTTRSYCS